MSWSRALVRHGAKARLAVAEVLRMPVEDVAVRDRSRLSAILGTGADVDGGCHVVSPTARRRPDR
jgi:hypothetical protein